MSTLKEITVKKGYMSRKTIKGPTGNYESYEDSAEATLTYEVGEMEIEVEAFKAAQAKVRALTAGMTDRDPDWINKPGIADNQEVNKNDN